MKSPNNINCSNSWITQHTICSACLGERRICPNHGDKLHKPCLHNFSMFGRALRLPNPRCLANHICTILACLGEHYVCPTHDDRLPTSVLFNATRRSFYGQLNVVGDPHSSFTPIVCHLCVCCSVLHFGSLPLLKLS